MRLQEIINLIRDSFAPDIFNNSRYIYPQGAVILTFPAGQAELKLFTPAIVEELYANPFRQGNCLCIVGTYRIVHRTVDKAVAASYAV